MTPDWAAKPTTVPYAKFGDPQTLNLYAYVENGPLNRIDPDGHLLCGPSCRGLAGPENPGDTGMDEGYNPNLDDPDAFMMAANFTQSQIDAVHQQQAAQNKPKPKPTPKPKPKAPKNSRTDVVLYGAGSGKPHHYNAVTWEMTWKAGTCSGGSCSQSAKNQEQTITGVEIDGKRPLAPIGDPAQGEANDYLSIEPRTITQWWSVDGQQVQVVLPSGESTWGVQIEVHGGLSNPPTYSPAPSNEPPQ